MTRALLLLALVASACAMAPKKYGATTNSINNANGLSTAVYGVDGSLATGVVAGAATYRSDWIDLNRFVGGISLDVAWSGGSASPAGTLGIEVSNADTPPNLSTA